MLRFALVCALLAALAPAPALSRPWTIQDVFGVEEMGDVQLSPGGAYAIVHYFGGTDVKNNTFSDSYRLVRIADGSFRTMSDGLFHPGWAPSGKAIAWLRSGTNGVDRLILTDARGGSAHPISNGTRSIVEFAWSPDGKRIATVETAAGGQRAPARFTWMTPESDYRDTRPPKRDVYLVDVTTGAERALTQDRWSYGGPVTDHDPSWSASGDELALVRQPSPLYGDFEHAQYVALNVGDGRIRQLVRGPFFAYPDSPGPQFAPHGKAVAYARTWDGLLPSREDVYVGDADVSAPLDRDLWSCGAGAMQWQGTTPIARVMDGVTMRLFRLDPGGTPAALTPPDLNVTGFSAAASRIAFTAGSPTQLSELYVLAPGTPPRQVTHFGALPAGLHFAQTRYVEWKSADGHTLHGQLTVPSTGALADVALVMEPHGGPQCADDAAFSGLAQLLADNGYAYFRPDPRGSDGYGDWSYKGIVDNWGEGPMADDMAGIDAVLASGVGNADRLYIEGGSYGGYLTTWITTHTNRFKAAVAEVPVTNLLLDYTLSESPNITRRFFGAKPSVDQALLARESPLTYAAGERTPLLEIIGLRDTRAPYAQAIEFYKTIVENGADARLLADGDAGHGPDDPQGVVRWFGATFGWLAQHGAPAVPGLAFPQ